MEALTAKAALVDPATLGDDSTVTTVVPRADIEEALKGEDPSDFYLDVKRVREGEGEEERRITISWEPADLERLLESTTSDRVAFGFKADELARMFDEPDVEAQGLRERVAVLTVAAATAAGASAGIANAMTMPPADVGGGGTATPMLTDTMSSGPAEAAPEAARFLTDATSSGAAAEESSSQFVTDATSSGPGAPVEAASGGGTGFVTDTTSSGPGATGEAASGGGARFVTDTTSGGPVPTEAAAATSGGGESFFATSGGEAALAGGLVLLIVGAGFAARRRPEPKPA